MKLRPVLSAAAIGVLIAAGTAIPSFATDDETPQEEVVSETPATPSPEPEDEPSSSPTPDAESDSEEQPEEETEDEEEESADTQPPPVVEYLLEATATPATRPTVQAAPPSPVAPETPVTVEAINSPVVEADSGSNAASNNRAAAEANNQPMAAIPQNSDQARSEVANSTAGNGSSTQATTNNSGTTTQAPIPSPLNLPLTPAQNVQFFGSDALAQALLDTQNSDDNEPVEEFTTGTSEEPGRVESRRIVRPDQATDAAPQDNVSEPQASPSAPQDTGSAPGDVRSAPQDNLVTTGTLSASLAIGGVLLIASGIALLSWRNRTSKSSK